MRQRRGEPAQQARVYEEVQIPVQPWRHIFDIESARASVSKRARYIFRKAVRDSSHAWHNDQVSMCNRFCELTEICQSHPILPSQFTAPQSLDQLGCMVLHHAGKSFPARGPFVTRYWRPDAQQRCVTSGQNACNTWGSSLRTWIRALDHFWANRETAVRSIAISPKLRNA